MQKVITFRTLLHLGLLQPVPNAKVVTTYTLKKRSYQFALSNLLSSEIHNEGIPQYI